MPIFIEWKWVKKTETFLAVFHFWDDGTKQNLRMRKVTEGYETCFSIDEEIPKDGLSSATPIPCYIKGATKHDAYLSWAPSHPEFCLLTELLTYANLINGLKPTVRRELRAKLEGHAITQEVEGKKYINFFMLDSELMKK
jgi:hypothetical protein